MGAALSLEMLCWKAHKHFLKVQKMHIGQIHKRICKNHSGNRQKQIEFFQISTVIEPNQDYQNRIFYHNASYTWQIEQR